MIDKPHEIGDDSGSASDSTDCSDHKSDFGTSDEDNIHNDEVTPQETIVPHLPQVSCPSSPMLTASSSNFMSKPQVQITSAIRQGLAVAQSHTNKDKRHGLFAFFQPCTREEFMRDAAKFQERIEEGREELKKQGKIQEQKRKQETREKARLRKRKSCQMKVFKEIQEGQYFTVPLPFLHESTGIHRNPLESAGILRNPQE